MRTLSPLLLSLTLLLVPALARAETWTVDTSHSTLGFSGSYQGEAFRGHFGTFTARIDFTPGQPDRDRFEVTVDLASVNTDNGERDQTLTGPDFFDTARFSQAHFVTTAFHARPNGSLTADGTLTLRGITRPVALHVTFTPQGKDAVLRVDTTLDRLAYDLGTSSDWNGISRQIAVQGRLLLRIKH